MGSILVMPIQYATTEPAAEPRPGPMNTPFISSGFDEITYNKEVTGKAHRFLMVNNLKLDPLFISFG